MADQKISQLTEKATLVGNDIITILDSENGNANKKAKVSAVTALSTYTATSPIDITSNVVSISTASTNTNGALTSTDWNTFNGKANVQAVVADLSSTSATLALASNTLYTFATALTSLTISSIPNDTYETEIQFTTDTGFTFTDNALTNKWVGGAPTFEDSKSYVIVVKNGLGAWGEIS